MGGWWGVIFTNSCGGFGGLRILRVSVPCACGFTVWGGLSHKCVVSECITGLEFDLSLD